MQKSQFFRLQAANFSLTQEEPRASPRRILLPDMVGQDPLPLPQGKRTPRPPCGGSIIYLSL